MSKYKIISVYWENELKEKFPKFRIVHDVDGEQHASTPYDFDTEDEAREFIKANLAPQKQGEAK